MTKKSADFVGMSGTDLMKLLADEENELSEYIKEGLECGDIIEPDTEITESSMQLESTQEYSSSIQINRQSSLGGIYFNVLRKGAGHNDPNWAHIRARRGARDYGYGRHAVGNLFALGTNNCSAEVWRPIWIGIGRVTYHTRIELYFDPLHWRPGGVAWWGEVWGWWSIGLKKRLENWKIRVTLS